LLLAPVATGCGKEAPAAAIDKAIQKNNEVKSLHVDLNIGVEASGDAAALGPQYEGLLPLRLAFSGSADVDVKDKPKAKGNIKFEGLDKILSSMAKATGENAATQLGVGMIGSALSSNMEFVLLDNDFYVQIAGNWYDTGDLTAATSRAGVKAENTTEVNCYQDAFKDTSKYGANTILKDIEELGDETIDGTKTRHFKANLNLDSLLTQLAGTMRDCGGAEIAGGIEGAKGQISNIFKKGEVELWISDDSYIRQGKVSLEIDPSIIASFMEGFMENSGNGANAPSAESLTAISSLSLDLTVKQSQFDQEFNITKPAGNVNKLEDLFGGAGLSGLGGLGGGSPTTSSSGSTTGTSTSPFAR